VKRKGSSFLVGCETSLKTMPLEHRRVELEPELIGGQGGAVRGDVTLPEGGDLVW
jgi:hypothetical protein